MSTTNSPRREPLSLLELQDCARRINTIFAQRGVAFALMGGAGCCLLLDYYQVTTNRATTDLDMLMVPDKAQTPTLDAERLSKLLQKEHQDLIVTSIQEITLYETPALQVYREPDPRPIIVDLEIFDSQAWPGRPQYDLTDPDNNTVSIPVGDGVEVLVMSPRWIVREKILTAYGRKGGMKERSDLEDVEALLPLLNDHALVFEKQDDIDALKYVLKKDPELEPDLRKKIKCPAVFEA
ncbi:hypothetical protein H1R20_g3840, partial [Candolleomyces eurysporus]